MFAVRDRYGIRPLCIGKDKHNFYVSSESCAFGSHIDFIRDVKPGEIVRIDKNGIHQVYLHPRSQNSLCSFEILYFANPRSFIDGLNIQNIRKKLGVIMGEKENSLSYLKNYTVIGIPETGICSAKAYAKYLNLKYKIQSDYDLLYRMIVKHNLKGINSSGSEVFGDLGSSGFSKKHSFFKTLFNEIRIRNDNGQNKISLIYIIIGRSFKKF